jgi:hypothetical protein
MSDKKCPKCGMWSSESALRCDCGYDFISREIKGSYLTPDKEIGPDETRLYPVASEDRRLVNYVIDSVINMSLFVIIMVLFPSLRVTNQLTLYILSYSTYLMYFMVFEALFQRTPAKFITGTKVVKSDGSKPNLGTIAVRTLCRFVPFDPVSHMGTPKYHRTWWHDRWTNTLVVRA